MSDKDSVEDVDDGRPETPAVSAAIASAVPSSEQPAGSIEVPVGEIEAPVDAGALDMDLARSDLGPVLQPGPLPDAQADAAIGAEPVATSPSEDAPEDMDRPADDTAETVPVNTQQPSIADQITDVVVFDPPAPEAAPSPDHTQGIAHLVSIAALAAARPRAALNLETLQAPVLDQVRLTTVPITPAAQVPESPIAPLEERAAEEPASIEDNVARTESIEPLHADAASPDVAHELPAPELQSETWQWRLLRYTGYGLAGYAALMVGLLVIFRFINPPGSALMAWRWAGGTEISRAWVPISNMSPNLVRAVIVAEDWTFCDHHGVDLSAMQEAIEKAGDGIPRGASTISMQVVKNVFLWPSKSYLRKAIELPMTLVMEILWPKRRVLEVYLNIAEWGPGIFGAEAAARHHFNKPASRLSSREAAQLAASLPNPFVRDAGDPGPRLARKATTIQNRMRVAGDVTGCVGVNSDSKAP